MEDMEIDAFTQKMLERTQARRDLINKKLPLLAKAITEGNSNNESNPTPIKQIDENLLKRKSSGAEEIYSPKRRSVEAPKDIDKENDDEPKDSLTSTTTVVRGLAALKKKTTDEIAGVFSSNPNSVTVLHDDTKNIPDSPHITHARSSQRFTHDNSKPEIIFKSPEKIPKLDACNKKVESPMKSKVVVRVPEVNSPREQAMQPAIEKQEAQGFTKSASASRLMYDYEKNADSSIKDRMKMFEHKNTPSSLKKATTLPRKLNPLDIFGGKAISPASSVSKTLELPKLPFSVPKKVDVPSSPKASQPSVSVSKPLQQAQPLVSSTPINVDPAALPLSARRAMFETPVNKSSCQTPELLTVSQRAALFEKAMNFFPKEGNSPKSTLPKFNSSVNLHTPSLPRMISQTMLNPPTVEDTTPVFQTSVNLGILKNGNGSKDNSDSTFEKKIVHFSPTKAVEPHTSQLQQHLLEKVNQTKTNDIASKMVEERKKELEELKNRWKNSPKKPFNPFGTNEKDLNETDGNDVPSQDSFLSESEQSESDNSFPPPPPPPPVSTSARFDETDAPKHMTPQTSLHTQTKLVCEKFDQMLDEVANEFSSESESDVEEGSPPRLYPSLSKLKKFQNSPTKVNISPTKGIHYEEEEKETPTVHYVEKSDDDSSIEQTTLVNF